MIDLESGSDLITEEASLASAEIVDNILVYINENCNTTQDLMDQMLNSTSGYLDLITTNILSNKVAGEDLTNYQGEHFDIVAVRASYCDLIEMNLDTGDSGSPSIKL